MLIFLQLYVRFADPEYNLTLPAVRQACPTAGKVGKAIEVITKNKKTIGIEEMILERARKEGLEMGLEKGLEKGIQKGKAGGKAEVVSNLILKMGMTDAQTADIAGVSVDL